METLSHDELWAALTPEERAGACTALWRARDEVTQQSRSIMLATLAASLRFREKFLKAQPDEKKTELLLHRLKQPDFRRFHGDLLRVFLLGLHGKMIEQFLDVQGIPHEGGILTSEDAPTAKSFRKGIRAIRESSGDRMASLYLGFILAEGDDGYWAALPAAVAEEGLNIREAIRVSADQSGKG